MYVVSGQSGEFQQFFPVGLVHAVFVGIDDIDFGAVYVGDAFAIGNDVFIHGNVFFLVSLNVQRRQNDFSMRTGIGSNNHDWTVSLAQQLPFGIGEHVAADCDVIVRNENDVRLDSVSTV